MGWKTGNPVKVPDHGIFTHLEQRKPLAYGKAPYAGFSIHLKAVRTDDRKADPCRRMDPVSEEKHEH